MGGSSNTVGHEAPKLAVGDRLTAAAAHLFEAADHHAARLLRDLPDHLHEARLGNVHPVVTHLFEYPAGTVFKSWHDAGTLSARLWYGVLLGATRIVRARFQHIDSLPPMWGTDLTVQFVAQTRPGEWDFFFPPATEPVTRGHFWRSEAGLEVLPESERAAFHAVFAAAMKRLAGRHAAESEGATAAAALVMQAAPAVK